MNSDESCALRMRFKFWLFNVIIEWQTCIIGKKNCPALEPLHAQNDETNVNIECFQADLLVAARNQ
jgi:hypothetical protein